LLFSNVKVHNVVVSASLGVELNLEAVAEAFPNVEYQPKAFPGLVFRLEKPKTATLLFENGKLICVGAKSEREAQKAVLKVVELLRSRGINAEEPEITVRNVVASADLESRVDLEGLCERAGVTASKLIYEPEQFPAAIYRMENPRVVFIIFPTGKTMCVGAKKTSEVHEAFEKLERWLKEKQAIYRET